MVRFLVPSGLLVLALAVASVLVGVGELHLAHLWSGGEGGRSALLIFSSRLPRTLALILAGAGMAVVGLLMQMLVRNRFVDPTKAGTSESAVLGILVVTLLAPELPVFARLTVASLFALVGTGLFLWILGKVPLRSVLVVPLVGLMLDAVITAVTVFIAYRMDLMQSYYIWENGDFSAILRGRYELLWLAFLFVGIAYLAADRFTVAGLGEAFSTNLGLKYRRVMALGMLTVSVVTSVVVVTCGTIPFVALIVPNLISLLMGDNIRRALPFVALLGAGLVLACDIFGRLVVHPHEIPIGTTLSVIGAGLFLHLLLRRSTRVA